MEEKTKKEQKYTKIEEETLKKLKESVGSFPPSLTAEENIQLLEKYKDTGDIKIRNQIVCGNLRFSVKHSYKHFSNLVFKFYKNQVDDLVQDLSISLADAVEKFDLSKGVLFTTFAAGFIRNQFLIKNSETKRLKNKAVIVSFSSPARINNYGDELTYEDTLADEKFTEENFATSADVKLILKKIVPCLSERERTIFKKYFLESKNQYEIAKSLNLAQGAVCLLIAQIRTKILDAYENGIESIQIKNEVAPKTFEQALSRQKVRNQRILKDYFEGVKVQELAKKYNMTRANVTYIIRNFKNFCQKQNVELPQIVKPLSLSAQKQKACEAAAQYRAERDKKILADYLQGKMSKTAIGKKYSMTSENVSYILSKFNEKAKDEGKQTQMQVKTPQQPLHKQ